MKEKGHWLYRHRDKLKSAIRIIFGIVWLIDGLLKFTPGTAAAFPQLIQNAGNGQPGWLIPWFDFWSSVVGPDPFFWATLVGVGEILIGIGLIVGGIRKITTLLAWSSVCLYGRFRRDLAARTVLVLQT